MDNYKDEKDDELLLEKDFNLRVAYRANTRYQIRGRSETVYSLRDDYEKLFNYKIAGIVPILQPMDSLTSEQRTEIGEVIKSVHGSPYGEIKSSGSDNLLEHTLSSADVLLGYFMRNDIDMFHLINKGLAVSKE